MNKTWPSSLPERNPVTQRAHGRQVLWQITIPILVVAILAITVAVLASLSGAGIASRWADISLIFLIIPVLIVAFLFLVFSLALIFGLLQLLKVLPTYMFKAQNLVVKVQEVVRSISDKIANPFIQVNSIYAGMRRFRGR